MPRLKTLLLVLPPTLALVLVLGLATLAWDIVDFGSQRSTAHADAAIVLGAAAWGNKPSPVYRERINEAIHLYEQGQVQWIIFTGGTREKGYPSEAEVGRQFSVHHGVPWSAMLVDTASHTTWENLQNARELMQQQRLVTALLVSDPLHLRRAAAMAEDLGLQVQPAPTQSSRFRSWPTWSRFLWRETLLNVQYRLFGQPAADAPE